ncbi:hypothetical protein ABGK97_000498 [Escherichia albertii]|uniref:hypothetical protein n=1 Tax=Escherichia albertii TaxID=208962 RepID=UPI0010781A58|nr:hypothetical protein [Escherichia albertii]EFA6621738.1 hypothetical protein [Escherichia albertii]EFA7083829.1 hypothetical protein [Escherichia albertii]EFF0831070.1 hypothetical protein [Escherichia albertii]EFF1427284.1 hypothetical protein [Escherichia albertii]EFL5784675.1 hypothetical protein [Escherichia albertii]
MTMKDCLLNLKIIIPALVLVLVAQWVGKGMSPVAAIPGTLMMLGIIFISLQIKAWMQRLPLPAFAWATLLGLLLSMPWSPVSDVFMRYTNKIDFLATTTPLLAFAGLSVGNSLDKLKSLSWRIVIISLLVFMTAFFGAAIVAQSILQMQGII